MPRVLQVSGSDLRTPEGRAVRLRGVGLGGWMSMENQALRGVLGEELYDLFFERFLDAFFGPDDARYLASLGLNLVRLPVNYRHLEGFRHLDRAIEACARQGIYTIIDLHAAPGGRRVDLWRAIAARYRDHPWVAGYDPLDPSERTVVRVCERLLEAIREEDPDHVVFFEGNRHSLDFHMLGDPWPNVVYGAHDYALPGLVDGGPYPGVSRGRYVDRDALERTFLERTRYMRETGTPIWIGEFGPVYTGDPERDDVRYRVLQDQLEIYERYGASWAIWTYKDVGLQGLVHTDPDSPWMRHIARRFEGVTGRDVEEMMDSFRLDRCRQRTRLANVLGRFAAAGACRCWENRP